MPKSSPPVPLAAPFAAPAVGDAVASIAASATGSASASLPAPSPADSGLLERLAALPGWSDWGQPQWAAAAFAMAAQAGARRSPNPESAAAILASIEPSKEQLPLAMALAARCGSVGQMERFKALGANPALHGELAHKENQRGRAAVEKGLACGPFTVASAPIWEALESGRPRAALWLLKNGADPGPERLGAALLAACKRLGPGETEADRAALRDALTAGLSAQSLRAWRNQACWALARSETSLRRNERAPAAETERAQFFARRARRAEELLASLRVAIEWGAELTPPAGDRERAKEQGNALGEAILCGDRDLIGALIQMGACWRLARVSERSAGRDLDESSLPCGRALLIHCAPLPLLEWAFDNGAAPANEEAWTKATQFARGNAARASERAKPEALAVAEWLEARFQKALLDDAVREARDSAPPADPPASGADAPASREAKARRI